MPELLIALDAFLQEHRRCDELDGAWPRSRRCNSQLGGSRRGSPVRDGRRDYSG